MRADNTWKYSDLRDAISDRLQETENLPRIDAESCAEAVIDFFQGIGWLIDLGDDN